MELSSSPTPSLLMALPTFPCVQLAVVMDETFSSGFEQQFVGRSLVPNIESLFESNGISGGFGDDPSDEEVKLLVCSIGFGSVLADPPESPRLIGCSLGYEQSIFNFDRSGSFEDGFAAMIFATETFNNVDDFDGFVPSLQCSLKQNVMLFFSDEGNTLRGSSESKSSAMSALNDGNWAFHAIVNQAFTPPAIGLISVDFDGAIANSLVYPSGTGEFEIENVDCLLAECTNGQQSAVEVIPENGFGNTFDDYTNLASASNVGSLWNINALRRGGEVAQSLENALVTTFFLFLPKFPSSSPTLPPAALPSTDPTGQPSLSPTSPPTTTPSNIPSVFPTSMPTSGPSVPSSTNPSGQPSLSPTSQPTLKPSNVPSVFPTSMPTSNPIVQSSMNPSADPSTVPSLSPTSQPTSKPSNAPSLNPTSTPTSNPIVQSSMNPSAEPSSVPSSSPTSAPTTKPSNAPSMNPTSTPTSNPIVQSSTNPSAEPSSAPSSSPTSAPTSKPSTAPSAAPTSTPTSNPSAQPSADPSGQPSSVPSSLPTSKPSRSPTATPTSTPTSRAQEILRHLNSVTLGQMVLQYPIPNTSDVPGNRAVSWIIDDDPLQLLLTSNSYPLEQRYVLALIWYSLGGESWSLPFCDEANSSTAWLGSGHECDWCNVGCDSDLRVLSLDLSEGNLQGQLPDDLGLLTSTTRLRVRDNPLSSSLPTGMGRMSSLNWLDLVRADVVGTIPSEFAQLENMGIFELVLNNMMSGTIPASLGTGWTNIRLFSALGNGLSGTVPSELGLWEFLENFSIQLNRIEGTLPSTIGNWSQLKFFHVSNNPSLSGSIPSEIANWVNLETASFHTTALVGTTPLCTGNFVSLTFLTGDCEDISCSCCTACCPTSFGGIPQVSTFPGCNFV